MRFMLDSNVVIAVALAAGENIRRRMAEHDQNDFAISSITYAEVLHGSVRGKPPVEEALQALVEEIEGPPKAKRIALKGQPDDPGPR